HRCQEREGHSEDDQATGRDRERAEQALVLAVVVPVVHGCVAHLRTWVGSHPSSRFPVPSVNGPSGPFELVTRPALVQGMAVAPQAEGPTRPSTERRRRTPKAPHLAALAEAGPCRRPRPPGARM